MNRRLLIAIGIVVIAIAAVALLLFARKQNVDLAKNKAEVDSLAGLSNLASGLEAKEDLLPAKAAYQKLVSEFPNSAQVMNWQKKIEDINMKLLFSPTLTPKSAPYEIKPGDTLTKIAKEFNTTPDLIMKSNRLADDKILPGRKLKVWKTPFSIFVDKSQNTLILKTDEEVLKTYIVSTGKNNSTPVGTFKITTKLLNPTWFKAGAAVPSDSPENILGTRWLGFNLPGYGIHGTTEPQNLGKQATDGCIRMSNQEVEEIYTIIPFGAEVTIVD